MSSPQNPLPTSDDRQLHVPRRDSAGSAQAAHILRGQIDRIYNQNPPNQLQQATAAPAPVAEPVTSTQDQTDPNPYHRTHQQHFDWQQYHTAWQQYYQQYYQRYYWQQLHTERQKLAAEAATKAMQQQVVQAPASTVVSGSDPAGRPAKSPAAQVKDDLLTTVKDRAGAFRRSHHFVPLASALCVGLAFLFLQFNSVLVAQVKAYVSPGALTNEAVVIDPAADLKVGPEPRLIVPKVNIDLPINYAVGSLDESTIQNGLKDGAVHYKLPGADAVPGQNGNTVILGHSSNDIFNQGDYKFVFLLLDRLQPGDVFYMHYEGKRYVYKVTELKVIDPTQVSTLRRGTDKPMATLVTCTPPGTALKRLLVFADQISPDPAGAAKPANPEPAQEANTALPGDGRSFLEQAWDFFF